MEYPCALLDALASDPVTWLAVVSLSLAAIFWLLYLCSGNPRATHPLLRRRKGFKQAALACLVVGLDLGVAGILL